MNQDSQILGCASVDVQEGSDNNSKRINRQQNQTVRCRLGKVDLFVIQ